MSTLDRLQLFRRLYVTCFYFVLLSLGGCEQLDDNTANSSRNTQLSLEIAAPESIDTKSTGHSSSPGDRNALNSMKAFKDPITGEYTKEPTTIDTTNAPSSSNSRSITQPSTLEERPSDIEGGGTVIELNGRFKEGLEAVRSP